MRNKGVDSSTFSVDRQVLVALDSSRDRRRLRRRIKNEQLTKEMTCERQVPVVSLNINGIKHKEKGVRASWHSHYKEFLRPSPEGKEVPLDTGKCGYRRAEVRKRRRVKRAKARTEESTRRPEPIPDRTPLDVLRAGLAARVRRAEKLSRKGEVLTMVKSSPEVIRAGFITPYSYPDVPGRLTESFTQRMARLNHTLSRIPEGWEDRAKQSLLSTDSAAKLRRRGALKKRRAAQSRSEASTNGVATSRSPVQKDKWNS